MLRAENSLKKRGFMDYKENHIEWYTGKDTMTLSLTQKKYINKVMKLKEKFPDRVEVIENVDGSICAHLPVKALHLQIYDREGQTPGWLQEDEE